MLENIRLSFQGVWSHRLRSFLTMLGIIIGIAAIIAIVSTIKGTNKPDWFRNEHDNSAAYRRRKLSGRDGIWNSKRNPGS